MEVRVRNAMQAPQPGCIAGRQGCRRPVRRRVRILALSHANAGMQFKHMTHAFDLCVEIKRILVVDAWVERNPIDNPHP